MTWNYRVVRHVDPRNKERYAIHEVYYNGESIVTVTEEPVCPSGETIEELKTDFEMMKEAFDKPVLDYNSL